MHNLKTFLKMIEAAEPNCTCFQWIKRSKLRGVQTRKSWKKTIIFIIICFVIFKLFKSSKIKKHDVVKSNQEKELRYLDIPLKSKVIVDSPEIPPLSNDKLSLDDITITIKSTGRYHAERVSLLLDTWVKKAINQTFIITDYFDLTLENRLAKNHLIVTSCGNTHASEHLCCKTSREYDIFKKFKKSWWCHFDDDVYVLVDNLISVLSKFDPDREQVYIGRRSTSKEFRLYFHGRRGTVQFHTGAGYCISRSLQPLLHFWMGEGYLSQFCLDIDYDDDVCVGAIIGNFLQVPLIENYLFHSNLDQPIPKDLNYSTNLKDQITVMNEENMHIKYAGYKQVFSEEEDPTNLRSIHCNIHPHDKICVKV